MTKEALIAWVKYQIQNKDTKAFDAKVKIFPP